MHLLSLLEHDHLVRHAILSCLYSQDLQSLRLVCHGLRRCLLQTSQSVFLPLTDDDLSQNVAAPSCWRLFQHHIPVSAPLMRLPSSIQSVRIQLKLTRGDAARVTTTSLMKLHTDSLKHLCLDLSSCKARCRLSQSLASRLGRLCLHLTHLTLQGHTWTHAGPSTKSSCQDHILPGLFPALASCNSLTQLVLCKIVLLGRAADELRCLTRLHLLTLSECYWAGDRLLASVAALTGLQSLAITRKTTATDDSFKDREGLTTPAVLAALSTLARLTRLEFESAVGFHDPATSWDASVAASLPTLIASLPSLQCLRLALWPPKAPQAAALGMVHAAAQSALLLTGLQALRLGGAHRLGTQQLQALSLLPELTALACGGVDLASDEGQAGDVGQPASWRLTALQSLSLRGDGHAAAVSVPTLCRLLTRHVSTPLSSLAVDLHICGNPDGVAPEAELPGNGGPRQPAAAARACAQHLPWWHQLGDAFGSLGAASGPGKCVLLKCGRCARQQSGPLSRSTPRFLEAAGPCCTLSRWTAALAPLGRRTHRLQLEGIVPDTESVSQLSERLPSVSLLQLDWSCLLASSGFLEGVVKQGEGAGLRTVVLDGQAFTCTGADEEYQECLEEVLLQSKAQRQPGSPQFVLRNAGAGHGLSGTPGIPHRRQWRVGHEPPHDVLESGCLELYIFHD